MIDKSSNLQSTRPHCPGCDKHKKSFTTASFWLQDGQPVGSYSLCTACADRVQRPDYIGRNRNRFINRIEKRLRRDPDRYVCQTLMSQISSQAGVDSWPAKLGYSNTQDDANWFKDHPDRSHRLRPAKPGELRELTPLSSEPPGCHCWVGIRQVEPGRRIRVAMFPPVESVSLLEQAANFEQMSHAIFDLIIENPGKDIQCADLLPRMKQFLAVEEALH